MFITILLAGTLIFAVIILKTKEEDHLVTINNYKITTEKFERDFKESAFAVNDTQESRKEFLHALVKRKLILQDAQARGLDKDKGCRHRCNP